MILQKRFFAVSLLLFFSIGLISAQQGNSLKLKLVDSLSKAPVSFATVYLSTDGSITGAKYALSNDKGEATITGVKRGDYILKAELMGYKLKQMNVTIDNKLIDLGEVMMHEDITTLDHVVVSALGNPIVVKKDTIEYNAASFKVTDNAMLEELLKKLPGLEIASDGTITANGKTINKITIDGKTFFLDDPQLALKNIPAKMVNKVKVVDKKSDQAEFTGIDDGNEETIIDLSVIPGMMRGWFGNVSAGGGMDIGREENDARYQGAAMIGRFTDRTQLSFIANGNNTNDRGFRDMTNDIMSSMRSTSGRSGGGMGGGTSGGGMFGGSNGITTSWMAGTNMNGYLLPKDAMKIGGNYLYNGTMNDLLEKSTKNTFISNDEILTTINNGESHKETEGHRAGAEIDWKISEKTSILFRPQFNIGYGDFLETSKFSSDNSLTGKINDGYSKSSGDNSTLRANGSLLLRQKIGEAKGRTISLNIEYGISNNGLNGNNKSVTNRYENDILKDSSVVDQQYTRSSKSYSLSGRLSYTEPLGKNFFLEAAYRYAYNLSESEKLTNSFNKLTGKYDKFDYKYSNKYDNTFINQNAQLNLMKQEEKYNVQVGFSLQPSSTKSVTKLFTENRDSVLSYSVLNFSPSARFDYRFSDYKFLRINYSGRTDQPSITQLQPVPDNSNPLYISLGNPSLQPSFAHSVRGNYRYTNMSNYASLNAGAGVTYTKDDITNASWYNAAGVQHSAPINSKEGSYTMFGRFMFNTPIAKSKFSIMSFTNLSLSSRLNYTGKGEAKTIEEIMNDLVVGRTSTLTLRENLTFVFRNDFLETRLGGTAAYSNAWYAVKEQEKPSTWTNSIRAEINATTPIGLEFKTDAEYMFYIGYDANYSRPQLVWNAEISQLLLKKKATIRVKMYDILNQARNVYRTTADNYVQDVQNNTLGQYFMVSFTYRFGTFSMPQGATHRSGSPMGGGRPRNF